MNERKKALIELIRSAAEDVEKWRKANCCKCLSEACCFPGSIDISRIQACENLSKLVESFVRLIKAKIITVNSNFSLMKVNLEGIV